RRTDIIPQRAGIGEGRELHPRVLGQEVKRGLQLEAGAPVVRAAERIAVDAGEGELRQVAWPNSGWCEPADQVRAHLEVIEHPQAAVPSGDRSALQMDEADDVGHDLVIGVKGPGVADELHVATHAGEILTELGQNSAVWVI